MLEVHRLRHLAWEPTPVVALVASPDGTSVAAAREGGAIEIWNVAPGSVGWYCKLRIPGSENVAISSLIWCDSAESRVGRLFSAGLDGFITEWDLNELRSKAQTESFGGSVWNIAARQAGAVASPRTNGATNLKNDDDSDEDYKSDDEEDGASVDTGSKEWQVAAACDDGSVRLFTVNDGVDGMALTKTLPRVQGRVLSVAWSADGSRVYSGGTDGSIRCWNVHSSHEVYRITAGTGGRRKPGTEFCIWALLVLRDGTLVSGDSSGSTQFWDNNGTLLQALNHHRADVLALAASPSNKCVFSGGADGEVAAYELARRKPGAGDADMPGVEEWTYLGFKRPHTHDVRALAVAVPLVVEQDEASNKKDAAQVVVKERRFDHRMWAKPGIPMLISGGNDAKLFAYSATHMLDFTPHDICPAPERTCVQLGFSKGRNSIVMTQHPRFIDIWRIPTDTAIDEARKRKRASDLLPANKRREQKDSGSSSDEEKQVLGQPPVLLARIKSKDPSHIGCSALSGNGRYLAFGGRSKPRLFELNHEQTPWSIKKRSLPAATPPAHQITFSADSTRLIMACGVSDILVLDVQSMELVHVFRISKSAMSPVTMLCASPDGQWLAAGSSTGELTVLNLELFRHHWSVPLYDGSPATAAAFYPGNSSALFLTTAANRIIVVDIEAKQLGRWSKLNLEHIPQQILEFPGGISGITICPSNTSTQLIAYSSRAMCLIDISKPLSNGDCANGNGVHTVNGLSSRHAKSAWKDINKNMKIAIFDDPVLFVAYTSQNSLLIFEKPWVEVLRQFPAPVYKHIYGT